MSIFGSLFKVIKKIVKKVVDAVIKFIKKYWVILLVVAVIFFAPYLSAVFLSWGMPTMSAFFSWIAVNISTYAFGFLGWAWSGVGAFAASAWGMFQALSFGTQAAIVGGAAALIAPDETAALIDDVTTTVGAAAGTVIGGAASGVGSIIGTLFKTVPWWVWAAGGGVLLYNLLPSSDSNGN